MAELQNFSFSRRYDGFVNDVLKPELLTTRALKGESFPKGTVEMLVCMMHLKSTMLSTVAGPKP